MNPFSFNGFIFITPAATAFSISSYNSCSEPIQSSLPSLSRHTGRGVPQKRERERFQSFRFSSQFPKRPVPVDSGCQLIVLFNSYIRSFLAVERINHESKG